MDGFTVQHLPGKGPLYVAGSGAVVRGVADSFPQAIGVSPPQPARDPYRLRRRRERVGGGICAQGL